MDIATRMMEKGYLPLSVDNKRGGIGFRPSLKKGGGFLKEPVWFEIGQSMKNGDGEKVPMTVCATDEIMYNEYVEKGWKPIKAKKATRTPKSAKAVGKGAGTQK